MVCTCGAWRYEDNLDVSSGHCGRHFGGKPAGRPAAASAYCQEQPPADEGNKRLEEVLAIFAASATPEQAAACRLLFPDPPPAATPLASEIARKQKEDYWKFKQLGDKKIRIGEKIIKLEKDLAEAKASLAEASAEFDEAEKNHRLADLNYTRVVKEGPATPWEGPPEEEDEEAEEEEKEEARPSMDVDFDFEEEPTEDEVKDMEAKRKLLDDALPDDVKVHLEGWITASNRRKKSPAALVAAAQDMGKVITGATKARGIPYGK